MKVPWLVILFTLLIFYVAATQLNWSLLISTLQTANLMLIAEAMGVWVILMGFKSLKWKQMLASVEGTISLLESARVLFIGLFVSVITPGRAGDFVRAIYVKDRVDIGKGILAVLIDRIIDIFSLLIFAGIGVALLAQSGGVSFISLPTIVVFTALFSLAMAITLNRKLARRLGWPLVTRFFPLSVQSILRKYGGQFYDALPLLVKRWPNIVAAIISSTIAWLLSITFGWLIMQALGLSLPWEGALAVVPVLALVEIIPVGVLGIGTRELAAVLILGVFTVPAELAVAYSLTYFSLGYIPSFIIGAFFFNRSPIPIKGGLQGILKKGFE